MTRAYDVSIIYSKLIFKTDEAEITAIMPLQRTCGAESRVRNKLSNGPLRVQSNGKNPKVFCNVLAYVSCRGYVGILLSAREKLRKTEKKTLSIEEKMEEIRIVNRAKWLLIGELKLDESEAHRYIEKQAMDRCVSKRVVAEEIIKTYSYNQQQPRLQHYQKRAQP